MRQEDGEFETSLSYTSSPPLKRKRTTEKVMVSLPSGPLFADGPLFVAKPLLGLRTRAGRRPTEIIRILRWS